MRQVSPGRRFASALALMITAVLGGWLLERAVDRGVVSTGTGLVLALLVAAGLAWLSALRRARAIHELVDSAEAMARGEPGRRARLQGEGELTALAGSLNRVAVMLERSHDELRIERDRFQAVLEGMAEGVIALSPEGHVLFCNPSATRMLGSGQAPIGRPLVNVLRQPALQELLARTGLPGSGSPGEDRLAGSREIELALPTGRQLLVTLEPLELTDLPALLVLRDVTALRKLETMRRDFVANVSHELRTPVATIQATAETLLDGALDDPAAARDFTATVHRHATRLSRILEDLMDLSRIEAGAYELELGPVALEGRLRQVARLLEPAVTQRNQELRITVQGRPVARANAQALDQVLFNLVDNASKYSPEGSTIELSAEVDGERVHVRVADQGPGVPLHQRERIFERFYRLDAGRSRQLGGTGLGLSIVRHLVEAMHGRVGVESRQPRGAVFRVELPADPVASSQEQTATAAAGRA